MVSESEARAIYADSIHFDGLNICNFSREIFESWHKGGFTGVSCTCGLWEGFRQSIANVVQWKKWFEEHSDLIVQAHCVADIRAAKKAGKTAVLLSWQNTAGIEDQLDYLRVFRDLGVVKMQLTYNTQNYSGAGYTELNDSGLTGFGRQVVDEMAKLGMVVDLSHVGPKTSEDTILYAPEGKPPCFSHILPAGLKEHTRNKSDHLIKLIGSKGGFVGLSQFGPHMAKGNDSTIDDYVDALEYVIGLIGEDLVGIGSDSSEGHGRPSDFMAWCNKDKGYARQLTPWGSQKVVKPLGPLAERAELACSMARKGWSEAKMRKVLGENWLNYLEKIIGR
ncbi:renal dipeptidase family [Microdochium trichocladiopsis]|uniref:Dipeptidase n=1 Tax=Microdochium trichocladiopsis TaxID=1682393 RepID=A0A9P9BN01_9PEZI|nr:renal dipeptidase family [Microdochium trichocladiopsis]KAH7027218.1 renal dipeptidase family [Microdochium trichocladiopsis]